MSAFPPQRSTPSVPVSQHVALKFLQLYLNATQDSPYLLPNARLEPSGPTVGSSTSSVTIHNLQRVEAGLRGEWLAPTLELQEDAVKVATGLEDAGEGDTMQVDGWQDLGEYQREQSIEEGEVAPRQTGVGQEGDADFEERVEVDTELDAPKAKKVKTQHGGSMAGNPAPIVLDKEAKKKEKKLRVKELQKKKKAELKAQEAEAEE